MQGQSKRRLQTKACIAGAKTFLLLYNIVFWFVGLILLITGIYLKASKTKFLEIANESNFGLPTLFIVTGVVVMVVAFFACSCISKEQPRLLYFLSTFFFLIFIIMISSSITGYVYKDNLKGTLKEAMNNTLNNYGNGGIMDLDFDWLQQSLECCGVDNFEDWKNSKRAHLNYSVPMSCCKETREPCNSNDIKQIYLDGCYPKLLKVLSENFGSIGLGMLFVAFFQIMGVLLAICLAKNINKALYEEMQ